MSSTTPTYRVECFDQLGGIYRFAWDSRRSGRPTDANAERYRQAMNRSFQPGFANAHIRLRIGDREAVPHLHRVFILRQADGMIIARAIMPMFEVVGP